MLAGILSPPLPSILPPTDMFIYLARHAWAGHFGDPGWPDDSLRELTPEGAERYDRVIETLAARGFGPQRIATSPYARCRQTADLIAKHTCGEQNVEELDALAPGSDLQELLAWATQQSCKEVCWVGHNPDMPALAAALLGEGRVDMRFAKGSIAAVRFDGANLAAAGTLYWHITAKSLGL